MILNHDQLKKYPTDELLADIAYHEQLAKMITPNPENDWIIDWNTKFIESIKAEIALRESK